MILLLSGTDSYTSGQKLQSIRERFSLQYGDYSIAVLDGADIANAATLEAAVTATPLMGTKRMVIIRDLLQSGPAKDLATAFAEVTDHVPEETVLVFYESGKIPDARSPLTIALKATARCEVSDLLEGPKLSGWISAYVHERGSTIARDATTQLTQAIGPDLARMASELDKLMLLAGERSEVTAEHVAMFLRPAASPDIFKLVDAIGASDTSRAVRELAQLRSSGEHALYLLKMIAYQLRNLVQARDTIDHRGTSADLARATRMHPFAAEKSMRQAARFTPVALRHAYTLLVRADRDMKSGRIDPDTALDRLVIALCTPYTQSR